MCRKIDIKNYLLFLLISTMGGTVCAAEENATALFEKQKSSPGQVLNLGIQYWFELKRPGKTATRVSNKFQFKSGDRIKIHVVSNSDSCAYVMLKEGSRGGPSVVLFPDPHFHDNNQLKAGIDCSLPADDFLLFDNNPGTEKLVLLFSRKPLDAGSYLSEPNHEQVQIAATRTGAKDLVPGSVVLAYPNQDESAPEELEPKQSQKSISESVMNSHPNDVATTVVQKDPGMLLSVELALFHEAKPTESSEPF